MMRMAWSVKKKCLVNRSVLADVKIVLVSLKCEVTAETWQKVFALAPKATY